VIIAIDGPAGSGKSTTAREVARRLRFHHLDSGAFYRALTFAALDQGIPPDRWKHLSADDLEAMRISARPSARGFELLHGSRPLLAELRSAEVNANVSEMASLPAVRDWLLGRLRHAADQTDLVADGRDIGTVVFPDAELKVFLVADPEERARRRLREQGSAEPTVEEVRAEAARLGKRDRADSERETAPLRQAEDAVLIDTSRLDFEEQVRLVVDLATRRRDY
jgi:CMP/dCMP kinase